jgi:hypothetical protein
LSCVFIQVNEELEKEEFHEISNYNTRTNLGSLGKGLHSIKCRGKERVQESQSYEATMRATTGRHKGSDLPRQEAISSRDSGLSKENTSRRKVTIT